MGIIKLICDRKEERVRQGRKVTAVDGRYFKLAENLLYGELDPDIQVEATFPDGSKLVTVHNPIV